MKWNTFLAASLLFSLPAMAHEDHEHEVESAGDFDVEAYQLTLQGKQPLGEACYIGVVSQGQDLDGSYTAVVETSFNHEGEGPGRLRVAFDAARPGFLTASTESGSQISVRLKENGATLADALRYAVRWTHEDHTDSGLCEGLSVVHDAAAEAGE
jgi:hypothetical protein